MATKFCHYLKRYTFLKLDVRILFASHPRTFTGTANRPDEILGLNKKCIYLMGSPGSGKTTIGKILGLKLGKHVIDMDDDILENTWGMPVSQKLSEVGGNRFIQEEGEALCGFKGPAGAIVSLSGSNPLHENSMKHIQKNGVIVFLDVPRADILSRLEQMKVDRIVGPERGTSISEILEYRQSFYEKHHDIRIPCTPNDSPENIANNILLTLQSVQNDPGYTSTRKSSENATEFTFLDTVLQGLASDGGLFVKSSEIPTLSLHEQEGFVDLNYNERTLRLLQKWINPCDIPGRLLRELISQAYNTSSFENDKVAPLKHLEGNQYLLELFHGPTASFKDFALQLMPQMFTKALKMNNTESKYLILVATSGDTGGAVLDGFRKYASNNVGVVVFYPQDGISELQRHQMVTMKGSNISVVGVNSDFDFCQSTVKSIFNDHSFTQELQNKFNTKLSAANSLNWGRLLPQIAYHATGYFNLVQNGVISLGDEIDICVPTGNFGNILAAYYMKMMGLPIRRLICASNSNDVLAEFLKTGCYDLRSRHLVKTSSPAIDILKSSNLERLLYHTSDSTAVRQLYENLESEKMFRISNEHLHHLQLLFTGDSCSEERCQATVRETLKRTGYLLDPHTAVAKCIADDHNKFDVPMIIAATAHYGKFGDSLLPWLDPSSDPASSPADILNKLSNTTQLPTTHSQLYDMLKLSPKHTDQCYADYNDIKGYVKSFAENM